MKRELKFVPKKIAEHIKKLVKSLTKDYVDLISKEENQICSFGFFTDSDISNFYFGYNTEEGMDKIIAEGIKYRAKYTDSNLSVDSSKWWLPEWINKVSQEVFYADAREIELWKIFEDLKASIEYPEGVFEHEDFSNYKEDVFDLLCESLEELKKEEMFSKTDSKIKISNDFYMLVQESDNGVYGTREQSLSKLLTNKQLEEYLKFYDDF